MPENIATLKAGYYKTKVTVIEHCRRILVHNEETEWKDFFESVKKKDDLSDAYVSGLSYINSIKKN
mgnify:CR=1 FL=1